MSSIARMPLSLNVNGKEVSCKEANFKSFYYHGYTFEWSVTIDEDDAVGLSIGQKASITIWPHPKTDVQIVGIMPNDKEDYEVYIAPDYEGMAKLVD